ncbi:hypothetical protein Ac2012v2_001856 [Leucoagaricus gongylophorus]
MGKADGEVGNANGIGLGIYRVISNLARHILTPSLSVDVLKSSGSLDSTQTTNSILRLIFNQYLSTRN